MVNSKISSDTALVLSEHFGGWSAVSKYEYITNVTSILSDFYMELHNSIINGDKYFHYVSDILYDKKGNVSKGVTRRLKENVNSFDICILNDKKGLIVKC